MAGEVQGSDNAMGWIIIGIIALVLMWLFWYFYAEDVRSLVRWVRYGEMWLVSWFVSDSYAVPWAGRYSLNHEQWFDIIPDFGKQDMTAELSAQIATLALYPLRWFFSIVLVAGGIWAYTKGPNTQYRKKHSIDTLIDFQASNFPYIAPFTHFNPSKLPPRPPGAPVPARLPLFSEALGPEEWLAYYSIPVPDGKVEQAACTRAFARQLGKPWRGWARLPKHKQVLLACFCLKSVRKRSECDTLLGRLAMRWTDKDGLKLDAKMLKEARSILKNREISGKVLAACNQHAFENTAMMRALQVARDEGGVLSPSQFVWLRGYDRTLWYPLNNLGRQTYHMEAIGAVSHYRHEKLTQRPILRPRVDDAVTSITNYMASQNARPIPALDYSKSKKRSVKKLKSTKTVS